MFCATKAWAVLKANSLAKGFEGMMLELSAWASPFFKKKICFIYWFLAVLGLSYGTWDGLLGCSVFSLVVAHGIGKAWDSSWGTSALWLRPLGSEVAVHRHSCLEACGILLSLFPTGNQTHVPCSGRWIPNYWTTTKVPQLELPNRTMIWRRSIIVTIGRFHFLTCYVVCSSLLTVYASVQACQLTSPLVYWVSILIC